MSSRSSDRYRTDPEYRRRQKIRSRLNYWKRKPIVTKPDISGLKTGFYAHLPIRSPLDARCGSTVRVPVFRVGGLAELFGVSDQTITLWTEAGKLPQPTVHLAFGERTDRAYTYDQLRLIWELFPLLNFPDGRDGLNKPGGMTHSAFARTLKRCWELMPDAVLPIYLPTLRLMITKVGE